MVFRENNMKNPGVWIEVRLIPFKINAHSAVNFCADASDFGHDFFRIQ